MKIALAQICSIDDKQANFQKARDYILRAAAQKADIICFAENLLYRGDDKEQEKEKPSSSYITSFQELAKTEKINIVLGTIILLDDNAKKPTNSCLVIDKNGNSIHRYDKQYMYDVERNDFTYRESDYVEPGTTLGLFELDGIKMGIGICVDLRYPEYFRELVRNGAEVIFLPSNFRKVTGQLAWDVLTKARAIENQVYFCACGQTGGEGLKERVGNTCVVSYDGTILSEIDEEEGIIFADIDLEALRAFRKEFPVLKQIKTL